MMKHKLRSGKRGWLAAGIALLLVLALAWPVSGMLARYRTQVLVANEVHYQNRLAASFKLLDTGVRQQEDGSYRLGTEESSGNRYKLIPGIQLPADPYILITGKTEIPAYLYLEVLNSSGLTITLNEEDWTELEGLKGKNGGQIYAYAPGALTGEVEDLRIDGIFTTEKLPKMPAESGGELQLYAYLIQRTEDSTDARAAFISAVPQQ